VEECKAGDDVCIKIEPLGGDNVLYGRHFDHTNELCSFLTRKSIDLLKENFKDDLSNADWRLVIELKKLLQIDKMPVLNF
jgi:translation initiation factor 5B